MRAKGERDSPRNSDCVLCGQEQLMGQRKRLLSLMKSDAGAFFMCVFRSEDRVWADRCSSLARDYEKGA